MATIGPNDGPTRKLKHDNVYEMEKEMGAPRKEMRGGARTPRMARKSVGIQNVQQRTKSKRNEKKWMPTH